MTTCVYACCQTLPRCKESGPQTTLTWGKRFLLSCQIPTLPITIAWYLYLGGACPPPHWVFQGFVAVGQVSGGNKERGGGGLTHLHLQHWVKWLWERVWDFSALGSLTSSVSRWVVKLTVSHYYLVPLPLQKRGYGDKIRKPVVFMIPSTGSGIGGRGMHNVCDFWN